MSQEALDSKIRKWNSLQGRRFGSSRKTVVDAGKQQLPPEALRRIIKDHGDMRCASLLRYQSSWSQLGDSASILPTGLFARELT